MFVLTLLKNNWENVACVDLFCLLRTRPLVAPRGWCHRFEDSKIPTHSASLPQQWVQGVYCLWNIWDDQAERPGWVRVSLFVFAENPPKSIESYPKNTKQKIVLSWMRPTLEWFDKPSKGKKNTVHFYVLWPDSNVYFSEVSFILHRIEYLSSLCTQLLPPTSAHR